MSLNYIEPRSFSTWIIRSHAGLFGGETKKLLENGREVDWHGLDVLGRLGGNRYCAVRSVIESETN
jgi:hypothetical protein